MKNIFLLVILIIYIPVGAQTRLIAVELNTENLYDTIHDSLKNDQEFLPDSPRHWNSLKYWQKINRIGKEIISCSEYFPGRPLPDIVALCEVENDSVLFDLTRRSLLRKARYEYVVTSSPDLRGINVALLYSPFTFQCLRVDTLRITPLKNMRPTRDILHVTGRTVDNDTLHVFVLHSPSRWGGEIVSRPYRVHVINRLCVTTDSLLVTNPKANIIVMGDFNDYTDSKALQIAYSHNLFNVSHDAKGSNGAQGTYRYKGIWHSLDHILVSPNLAHRVNNCTINDQPFLTEPDEQYGGIKPRRNYLGMRFNNGFSDHLPLVLEIIF